MDAVKAYAERFVKLAWQSSQAQSAVKLEIARFKATDYSAIGQNSRARCGAVPLAEWAIWTSLRCFSSLWTMELDPIWQALWHQVWVILKTWRALLSCKTAWIDFASLDSRMSVIVENVIDLSRKRSTRYSLLSFLWQTIVSVVESIWRRQFMTIFPASELPIYQTTQQQSRS